MSYYGSWKLNDTLTFVANTHNPTNGMATNADAVPSYHVYEDETAAPILTGTMSLLNNPNTIGFYSEQITLSAANGLEKGKSYNIYIRAVVNNVTGTMSHSFQMEAEVDANTVSVPVTAGMVTGSVLGNVDGSVGSVIGNVGGSVGSVVSPVTAGSVTGSVLGNVNGSVGSVSGNVGGNLVGNVNGNVVGSVGSVAGNVAGSVNSVVNPVTAGNVTGSVLGNVNGSVGSVVQPVGISTGTFLEAVADKVWDEAISGHLTAGSTGEKLNSAGSAGDPWGTALPGSYTPGQAGHILASRMPTGTVIVGTNQDKTGYSLSSPQNVSIVGNISGTFVGNIQGNVSGSVNEVLTIGAALANKIADHVLRRTFANARGSSDGDAVSFRSLLGAIAKLVNKWSISGTTLTVYAEDDSTSIGTQTLTGTAGADPITQIDTD